MPFTIFTDRPVCFCLFRLTVRAYQGHSRISLLDFFDPLNIFRSVFDQLGHLGMELELFECVEIALKDSLHVPLEFDLVKATDFCVENQSDVSCGQKVSRVCVKANSF